MNKTCFVVLNFPYSYKFIFRLLYYKYFYIISTPCKRILKRTPLGMLYPPITVSSLANLAISGWTGNNLKE